MLWSMLCLTEAINKSRIDTICPFEAHKLQHTWAIGETRALSPPSLSCSANAHAMRSSCRVSLRQQLVEKVTETILGVKRHRVIQSSTLKIFVRSIQIGYMESHSSFMESHERFIYLAVESFWSLHHKATLYKAHIMLHSNTAGTSMSMLAHYKGHSYWTAQLVLQLLEL